MNDPMYMFFSTDNPDTSFMVTATGNLNSFPESSFCGGENATETRKFGTVSECSM